MDFFRGAPADEAEKPAVYIINVLKQNWRAFKVFESCQLQYIATGFGATCVGIPGTELQAALMMSGYPQKLWPRLSKEVSEMGRAASSYLNQKAEKERKKKGSS